MTFSDFLRSRNVTASPRGTFIAEIKTLVNAGAFPDVRSWADLYRFLTRRHASDETIALARNLWREYRKLEVAGVAA
ncbi:hypothetical protein L6654_24210 [Bradyrhizobium sp. WYCCWR 13023]|uniref:YozE SAM-like domain-containing protein n=1 Tax=Bradyrhizobium zhengyangense TaxID=2911009 RepID=A0A9X1UIG3_9BRAD|nr:hypothetical protein [Bradyrhizobium zhengyangense]MCG2629732.1 hypothetical protein [Bradyrhizobium zhengyangense]